MDDDFDILLKISNQLETIIQLLEKILEQNKPFVPPDCEHL